MIRALLPLLLAAAATPAIAQHAGHARPVPSPAPAPAPVATPAAGCTPEHAAMGHCTMAPAAAPVPPASSPGCTPEHAAMGHCTMPAPAAPTPPASPAPAASASCPPEHAAMGHCTPPTTAAPPLAPPPAAAQSGPAHAADLMFGSAAMARARDALRREHGGMRASKLLVDRLEWRAPAGGDGFVVDAQGWYGGDIDKLWLKVDVAGARGDGAEAQLQALWSRAVDPWFDVQGGLRVDAGRGPGRSHLVLGVQGLAPYWWEVDGALFLSNKGELTARAEAEYDLRVTQRLIVQPSLDIALSAQDIEELGIGSGLSSVELGVRLRYQLSQQFAPYVGLSLDRAFGATRRFRRADGEKPGGLGFIAGLRFWF